MADTSNNTAINGYFQQKIFNDIIKKTNASSVVTSNNVGNHSIIKFKSYHAKLLEKKLDDGWNRMRGKMKKFADYNAPNSDYSSDEDCSYESSYSYKFFFESFALTKEKEREKSKKDEDEINSELNK